MKKILTFLFLLILPAFLAGCTNSSESNVKTPIDKNIIQDTATNDSKPIEYPDTSFEYGKVVSVSDGDTIRIEIAGDTSTYRLIGIDTPEIHASDQPIQCYGPEAQQRLETLILDKNVKLEKDISDTDKYDRYLRYVWLGDSLINEALVKEGFAFSSRYEPDIKYQDRFSDAENYAKDNGIGLWNADTCNGEVYTGTYLDPNKKVVNTNTSTNNTYVAPEDPVIPPVSPTTSKYVCNCAKACAKMYGCEEAYFQLNDCGCSARDGDGDGVPCESICK